MLAKLDWESTWVGETVPIRGSGVRLEGGVQSLSPCSTLAFSLEVSPDACTWWVANECVMRVYGCVNLVADGMAERYAFARPVVELRGSPGRAEFTAEIRHVGLPDEPSSADPPATPPESPPPNV